MSLATLPSSNSYSLSSKSASNQSDTTDYREEEDFTKDKLLSPIDLECSIQTERITKIFHELICKVKLGLCLPHLVKEGTLSTILKKQHYEELIFIYEEYGNMSLTSSLINMPVLENVKAGNSSMKDRLNPELGHLIYILNSYPALRPVVEEMVEMMKEGYVSHKSKPPQPALEYLLAMERFRDLTVKELERTAADQLDARFFLRKTETSNDKLIKEINECTSKLKQETERLEDILERNNNIITNLEDDLTLINSETTTKIEFQILDSERQMVLASRSHAVKSEMLLEEVEQSRDMYEKIKGTNLVDEKKLRKRKFKCETHLLTWKAKYDLEMGDKQVELDGFQELWEEQTKKCEDLQAQLAEQEEEFSRLMAEREEEYHKELNEKMMVCMRVHAARVIQTAWRNVIENRAAKKKLKKLVKKKQQEDEAAEKKSIQLQKMQAKAAAAAEKTKKKKKKK